MSRKKILIVEDNEDTREILLYRIRSMGDYDVRLACDGEEALHIAPTFKPDLIIMDLKMPILDGWEATKALRMTEWGRTLPVIALTAQAMEKDEEKALSVGCSDYIAKPIIDYAILQNKIEKHLK